MIRWTVPWKTALTIATLGVSVAIWDSSELAAQAPASADPVFDEQVKPLLRKHCVSCHNADSPTSGVRVDHLDASIDDRHVRIWEGVRRRIADGSMPPKGLPQPTADERSQSAGWIDKNLEIARLRPSPRNGLVRRLTKAQYRNTLRELLLLDDDLTEALPPDAVSKDGFVNNKETLQLSPLLIEAYLEIADQALSRAIVDPKSKPAVQNFRMDLGAGINRQPLKEKLILGADSLLLENQDFTVTQLTAQKPFPFEPFFMKTKYRFIEGYQGNDTVRGWREYDSIYHSVFACMRGKRGYPKGEAYSTVPEGLLLRPSIPNDELFEADGTYGPRANFKVSLRELPDNGRFRVTVTAAKYNDGLLLDENAKPASAVSAVPVRGDATTAVIPKPGVYQVDVYPTERPAPPASNVSRLNEALAGSWPMDGSAGENARLEGRARFVDSPFTKALSIDGMGDSVVIPRSDTLNVGTGDFTVSAWIYPRQLARAGIVARGKYEWTHGWYLDLSDGRGSVRFETAGPGEQSNGSLTSPPGVIRAMAWQQVTAVVRRAAGESKLYVNGYLVAKGDIGAANLDNPKLDLHIGRIPGAAQFHGELDEVRLYRRALDEAEVQGLVDPGRRLVKPPTERPPLVELTLGGREFSGTVTNPAFLAVRLNAGTLPLQAKSSGVRGLDRIVFTPVSANGELAKRFEAFEKRVPKLGVHLGLRRDCGSTFAPVGPPQAVAGTGLTRLVFEGAIRNFPSPDVEKDNVNYLAGIREIAVRSEYTDGRDMPRLLVRSVEFEGPYYDAWPPPSHTSIFSSFPRKSDEQAYGRHIIRNFAARAFRRPLAPPEDAALVAVFDKSVKEGRGFQESVKDALQVVLTSPQFLFLVETSASPKPETLDQYELASKLSYFLWNGPPDRRLLGLASTGALRPQLNAEVDRLIADARFGQFIGEYANQWLSLDKFQVLEPDRKRFPNLTRDTRTHLKQEPVEFLRYLIQRNLPVKNLIDSEFVVANEAVASYYDLASKPDTGFDFIAIPHGRRELGGVMTQAAIMAGLSDGRESNPVKRGAWLARKIVAEPPDDPPPNVPALKESEEGLTLRQRIEQHRNQAGCRQCHTKIDPWGVAFEEYDAGGRLKTQPADARSTLPDKTEVSGAADLKRYLSNDRIDQVAFSALKHMATYATGRTLTYSEVHQLKQDALQLRPSGYRMKDMVKFVASSKLFLEK